ncbi:Rid family hydrolase, partial [Chloroflexota bacterium]
VVGDWVFVSGAGGREQGSRHVRSMSPVLQIQDALDKLTQRLNEAGTSLENTVCLRCFVVGDMGEMLWDGPVMDYFRKNAPKSAEDMPAVTIVGLNNLCVAEMIVEVEAIAVMPERST